MLAQLGRWRVDPRALFVRNASWKIAALIIALVASGVAARTVQETTRAFEGRIPVERASLPEGHILRGSLGEVEVSVRGPADSLAGLSVASFAATVDLSAYDRRRLNEPQELPIRVNVSEPDVRVVDVRPSTVVVRLVPLATRLMPVQLQFQNEPPAGYQVAAAQVTPEQVEVRGPADALQEVVGVVAAVSFPSSPVDLALSLRAVPVDGAGREVAEVEAEPRSVEASVLLAALQPTRTVAVVPVLRGNPAPGFWVAAVAVSPPVATIRGDAGLLDRTDRVETVAVDITGASAGREARPLLILPEGTSLARPVEVVVSITVRELRGTRPFPLIAIGAQNVPPDMVAEVSPPTVSVTVAGTINALNALEPQQVVATVDVGDRGEGTHELVVRVEVPPGLTVSSVSPTQVSVTVRPR